MARIGWYGAVNDILAWFGLSILEAVSRRRPTLAQYVYDCNYSDGSVRTYANVTEVEVRRFSYSYVMKYDSIPTHCATFIGYDTSFEAHLYLIRVPIRYTCGTDALHATLRDVVVVDRAFGFPPLMVTGIGYRYRSDMGIWVPVVVITQNVRPTSNTREKVDTYSQAPDRLLHWSYLQGYKDVQFDSILRPPAVPVPGANDLSCVLGLETTQPVNIQTTRCVSMVGVRRLPVTLIVHRYTNQGWVEERQPIIEGVFAQAQFSVDTDLRNVTICSTRVSFSGVNASYHYIIVPGYSYYSDQPVTSLGTSVVSEVGLL